MGKAHPEMAALDSDESIPVWRRIDRCKQAAGYQSGGQINGGAGLRPRSRRRSLSHRRAFRPARARNMRM